MRRNTCRNHTFDEAFVLLKEYLELHNNVYPESYFGKYKDIYLGPIIGKYRNIFFNGTKLDNGSYTYNRCTLTQEQIDKLNSINFVWVGDYRKFYRKEFTTKEKYEAIKKFLEEDFKRYLSEVEEMDSTKISNEYTRILNKRVS